MSRKKLKPRQKMMIRRIKKVRYFFEEWERIRSSLAGKRLLFFLDYDGTLTPIVETPQKAILEEETRKLLESLARISDCQVTIVTGRSLSDIKKIVGLKKITYIGNHGFEVYGPRVNFQNSYFPKCRKIFYEILKNLQKRFRDLPGVIIEDKVATLSVHYRMVDDKKQSFVKREFQKAVRSYLAAGEIRIRTGKKVLEIRPPVEWDKGKAILWFLKDDKPDLRQGKALAIYIGDDETDEDAFKDLKNLAMTIYVGPPKATAAQYYLKDVDEVLEFLKRILELKKGNHE